MVRCCTTSPTSRTVFRWYRELLPALPDELSGWLGVTWSYPSGPPFPEQLWARKAGSIVWCYSGPHDKADDVLAAVREFGSPLPGRDWRRCRTRSCRVRSTRCCRRDCSGTGRSTSSTEITDEAIALHGATARPSRRHCPRCTCIRSAGPSPGCAEDATAFAYRDGGWTGVIAGIDPDPANLPADHRRWAQPVLAGATREHRREARYVNMMMEDEGEEADQGRLTAATTTGYLRSRSATTRPTSSTSTRTSHLRPSAGATSWLDLAADSVQGN